ncbi:hypothetical protein NXG27_04165 [Megasphaera paucivorans]|uniref:Uncharacterized protein n=1 Tax=Megasphaera paucivorans TaxID=349095 RepID=A0A1G9QU21_9FIRM|nr:hypothetical protein [Megasphaera paucivorans]SDM14453.1 hypothetical protein SAMN05660299_00280 [Megasphaera paucivorans]
MELTEYTLNKQREMAQSIKNLLEQEIVNTTDEIRLSDIKTGVDYCNGAIVSCRLAAEILKQQKEAKKAEEATAEPTTPPVDEKTTADEAKPATEDKPKKRSHHRTAKPPVEEPAVEEDITADLDDLF